MTACILCEKPIPDLRATCGSIYSPICSECDTDMRGEMGGLPVYGRFIGGDPRKFQPDTECCFAEEIALWKEHCAAWDRGEYPTVKIHGIETINGQPGIVDYANYGLGVNNP